MSSLVSILVPCYNGEVFIERCLKCLYEQTYENVEVIFINDGSTDNTETIAKNYSNKLINKGYKFKYIYKENGGAADAINSGLKYVKGKYIMLYDVDDIIFPDAIYEKVKFLENNKEYDMVRNNGYYVFDDDIDNINGLFSDNDIEKNNEHIFEDLILGKTNNWPASFMVRSEALFNRIKDREIYISHFGQNLQIMLPVSFYGKSGYIDKPLMKYVRHSKSHSSFTSLEKKLKLFNGYEQNRIEIIRSLEMEDGLKLKYTKLINELYYRIRMQIAYEMKNKELLIEQYESLCAINSCNFKDKLLYMRGNYSIFDKIVSSYNFLIRIISKVRRELKV